MGRIRTQDELGMMTAIVSRIVEANNVESGEHILHVQRISSLLMRQLAQKRGFRHMREDDVALISAAAALHDIGKTAVPPEILNKPGPLDREETQIMRRHADAGAAMLDSLTQYRQQPFVRCARSICLYHHERWDGGGYPSGLVGSAIPMAAQLVSVADVYDALTGQRCYKDAIPHATAMGMIEGGECGAFNPLLLGCLRELDSALLHELA